MRQFLRFLVVGLVLGSALNAQERPAAPRRVAVRAAHLIDPAGVCWHFA